MYLHRLGRPAMPIKHRKGEPTVFDKRYLLSQPISKHPFSADLCVALTHHCVAGNCFENGTFVSLSGDVFHKRRINFETGSHGCGNSDASHVGSLAGCRFQPLDRF